MFLRFKSTVVFPSFSDVIESCITQSENDFDSDCMIWDGMVLLQKLASVQLATFGEVAEYVLRKILLKDTIYFVTDLYKDGSIKSYKRERRKSSGSVPIRLEKAKTMIKLLKDEKNKSELIEFLYKELSHPLKYANIIGRRILYVNHGSHFHKIWVENNVVLCVEEELLFTEQEEADTKVFLCVKHSVLLGVDMMTVSTVDTDIVIYSLFFCSDSDVSLYIEIGVAERRRTIL